MVDVESQCGSLIREKHLQYIHLAYLHILVSFSLAASTEVHVLSPWSYGSFSPDSQWHPNTAPNPWKIQGIWYNMKIHMCWKNWESHRSSQTLVTTEPEYQIAISSELKMYNEGFSLELYIIQRNLHFFFICFQSSYSGFSKNPSFRTTISTEGISIITCFKGLSETITWWQSSNPVNSRLDVVWHRVISFTSYRSAVCVYLTQNHSKYILWNGLLYCNSSLFFMFLQALALMYPHEQRSKLCWDS